MSRTTSITVVLGNGSDDKAHAARFDASELGAARKAAGLMGFRLAKAVTEPAQGLARKLPEGKIFASGKGLLPLVKADLYEQLLATLDFTDPEHPPGGSPAPEPIDPTLRKAAEQLWANIKVGSLVLVFDDVDGRYPNWCAAIVTAIGREKETLTARWRDYPGCEPFAVKRHAVGLLPPASK